MLLPDSVSSYRERRASMATYRGRQRDGGGSCGRSTRREAVTLRTIKRSKRSRVQSRVQHARARFPHNSGCDVGYGRAGVESDNDICAM